MSLSRTRGKALIGAAAIISALAVPAGAQAATSIEVDGSTVRVTGDGADDAVTLTVDGGNLAVNGATDLGGGDTRSADDTLAIVVDLGAGRDTLNASALTAAQYGSLTADGGAGDDLLTGGIDVDVLRGSAGDDRVVGGRGNDDLEGGDGNDTLVWNNGDNTDVMDGEAGADEVEVNGAPTAGDVFTVAPNGPRVKFDRTNLVPFSLDIGGTERLALNGLGGDDSIAGADGLAPLTSLALSGGTGNDALTGGDGADLVSGGDGADALSGGGGGDRVVGDRGGDTFAGGAGDDVLVWNNGDGSDVMNGDDGLDRVEVNGALGAGDAFTVVPNGGRAKFDRTNLVPFTLDIGAEGLEVNGFGGDDAVAIADGTPLAATADGGAGNDTLTGSAAAEALRGGSGDDVLTGGGGIDALDGEAGNDRLEARDGAADQVRCGDGSDAATTDFGDVVEGCEANAATAGPDTRGLAAAVRTSSVGLRNGRVRVSVECPAAEAGGCKGTVTLRTAGAVRLSGVRTVATLGQASFTLRPGQRRTVSVKLTTGARRLARRGRIAARAVVASADAAGNRAQSSRRVTVRVR